jgi:hypothetical protein
MRRDPAAQFWGVILTLGAAVLLGGVGVLAAVSGHTTDTERWVGVGLIGSGTVVVLIAGGGFANLYLELRENQRQDMTTPDHSSSVFVDPTIVMGMALLRVRNDGASTAVQIQVESLEGIEPATKLERRLLNLPYTAPWLSPSDKIKDIDWNERREKRLITGAAQTVALMTAWGERFQLWGADFHDGHLWAISRARRRTRIRFEVSVLAADGPPRREWIEFRRTATGITIPTDQKRVRTPLPTPLAGS